MFKDEDRVEKVYGAIFGTIAVLAAVVEMALGGFTPESVVGAIKDIAGTAVVFVVLLAFINNLPHKPKNLVEILERSVEDWGSRNIPLIFKTEDYQAAKGTLFSQGFSLLQHPETYISLANNNLGKNCPEWKSYAQYGNGKLTGKFLDMPSYKSMTENEFTMLLTMEQKHFKDKENINGIINDIVSAIRANGNNAITAERIGSSLKIKLTCGKIATDKDVEFFVDALDFMLSLIKVVM